MCDEAHVILGVKGSGKTAISKVVAGNKLRLAELEHVIAVPALATQTSSVFTSAPNNADESVMRQLWMAHFLTLTVARLVSEGLISGERVAELTAMLEAAGMPGDFDRSPNAIFQ